MPARLETLFLGLGPQSVSDATRIQLKRFLAMLADQELAAVSFRFRVRARNVGIEGLQSMHETVAHQEIQRAIDGRRRGRAGALLAHLFQQVIGLHGSCAVCDQFEHAPTQFGQAQAAFSASVFDSAEHVRAGVFVFRMSAMHGVSENRDLDGR